MKLKLNKTIKTKIVENAIKDRFNDSYTLEAEKLVKKIYEMAFVHFKMEEYENTHEMAKKFIPMASEIKINCSDGLNYIYESDFSICAMRAIDELYPNHLCQSMPSKIWGRSDYCLNDDFIDCNEKSKTLKPINKLRKEIINAADVLLSALEHYKTAEKAFKELPWVEKYYLTEYKQQSAGQLIPVSVIAAANDLMGVK